MDRAPCEDVVMASSRVAFQVSEPTGARWEAALDLLEAGEASIGLRELTLNCDPATDRADRRLHIEFPCPFEPLSGRGPARDQLAQPAERSLREARELIESVREASPRFAALLASASVLYEYVHDYGMGTLLVATARPTGPLTWK